MTAQHHDPARRHRVPEIQQGRGQRSPGGKDNGEQGGMEREPGQHGQRQGEETNQRQGYGFQLAAFDMDRRYRALDRNSGASSLEIVSQASEAEICEAMTTMAGATESAIDPSGPCERQITMLIGKV